MKDRTSGRGSSGLGVIIIGPTGEYTDYLYREFVGRGDIDVYKTVAEYPTLHHLVRILNSFNPSVIFLEMTFPESALRVARDIQAMVEPCSVIGFGDKVDPQTRQAAGGIGVFDILPLPVPEEALKQAIGRALDTRTRGGHDNVVAFLPAKAGSGATTTALNVAGALARDCARKTLIVEADLHSGLLPVLFNLDPQQSIVEALQASESLTDERWKNLVSKAHGLDLLPTPYGKTQLRVTPWHYHRLLAFASPRYDHVVVDLPEVVNDATEAIALRASSIYVVCTPESQSLFLARRRIHELETRNVRPNRIKAVLNRCTDGNNITQAESLLGRAIDAVLPNDYGAVLNACQNHGLVTPACPLGKAYSVYAYQVAGIPPPPEPETDPALKDPDSMRTLWLDEFLARLRGPLTKLRASTEKAVKRH